jgi:hypothetical protein
MTLVLLGMSLALNAFLLYREGRRQYWKRKYKGRNGSGQRRSGGRPQGRR